jgi:predicted dehydrogenase
MKRRNFIGKTAAGMTALTIVPRQVLGGTGFVAPSDMINIAYIGLGKQSYHLANEITKCPEAVIVAACDVYGKKLDLFLDHAREQNAKKGINSEITPYHYYRELLERTDIDAVVIITPDHWHAQIVVDAAKAEKDIYCEKPMALTVAEGRSMVNATRKYDRVFQTGNMQRSWRDFRHAVELVRNGYIGQVKEINVSVGEPIKQCDLPTQEVPATLDWNEWVGPSLYRGYHEDLAPPTVKGPWAWWRGYRDFGGGLVTDWGAHMFDISQWALDMDESGPVRFIPPAEPAQSNGLTMIYKNGVRVNHKLWGGEGDGNAVQFIGSEGSIEVSRSFLRTFPDERLAGEELRDSDQRVYYSDNHYQDWIDAIKKRTKPISDVETGHRTASVCNLANIAYELERPLLWDPDNEKFIGDDWADMMLSRPYRGKWDFNDF